MPDAFSSASAIAFQRLRVLILEDSPKDAELMALRLSDDGFSFDWQRVQTESDYLAALRQRPDLILADWQLPRFSGSRALALMRDEAPGTPFIIVSGGIGEEAAVAALRAGASDYVLKDRPARLGAAVRRALSEQRLRRQHEQAQERLRLADRAFKNTAEGIMITDAETRILSVNPAFETITGFSAEHALGRTPGFLQSGRHPPAFYRRLWLSLKTQGHWRGEIWNRRADGEIYPEWLSISAVREPNGETSHYVAVFRDLSQLREARARLDFLARHDPLTSLPNRAQLIELIDRRATTRDAGSPCALLFIDLDRFKTINETLGHTSGDALLQRIATRLSQGIAGDAVLARNGGDEFAVFLPGCAEEDQAGALAHQLLLRISQTLTIAEHRLVITASIGIALTPRDANQGDTLIRCAERAMYEAKRQGRNRVHCYAPALTAGAVERLLLENALRRALDRGDLRLAYQPQFELGSGRLAGVEALVRWKHPELGDISPARFIPLAEEIDLIGDIGCWVLREACQQIARWDTQALRIPRIAVNLSVLEIARSGLVERVRDALAHSGIAPERLELEVTESMLVQDPDHVRRILGALTALGTGLAIDDFGTGYSSLSYLKLLPVNRLKIDQSFVRDIGHDTNDEAIVRAIIALADNLGLETVAEGVEDPAQEAFLRRAGCKLVQGHLYAPALPPLQLDAALQRLTSG
jgi:diguanylate cyclase (GGDEF)-like protein/PAS domain S-box-containing protein